jgi:large subunit ribosomal protein L3
MTQVFGEDGTVERVSVVEAGPCHVTAIRSPDRDGYEAVQLGFAEVKEKRITKAERGHLKKADAPALRRLAEFRDEAGELQVGETVKADVFEKGQKVKVSGVSKGKGFQGTTCAPPARSAPRPRRRACSRASAGRVRWAIAA